jgi:hypothetical protein
LTYCGMDLATEAQTAEVLSLLLGVLSDSVANDSGPNQANFGESNQF